LEWVGRKGSVTARDACRNFARFGTGEEARTALDALAEAGKLRRVSAQPGPKGGQPTVRYELP
jgi:hypothetical protein